MEDSNFVIRNREIMQIKITESNAKKPFDWVE